MNSMDAFTSLEFGGMAEGYRALSQLKKQIYWGVK
jgi:hypothetical protein